MLALVLFGGGIAIGAVVADGRGGSRPGLGPLGNHRYHGNHAERGFGRGQQVRPGFGNRPGFGPGHLPRPGNSSSTAPSPSPSTSHS